MTTTTPPEILIQRLIESRSADQETSEFLADAMAKWLFDPDLQMCQCFQISPNRDRLRKNMRNHWLRDAASLIDAPTPWKRARLLRDEALSFERRQWPLWSRANLPPPHANGVQARLFYALRTRASFPTSVRMFHEILKE